MFFISSDWHSTCKQVREQDAERRVQETVQAGWIVSYNFPLDMKNTLDFDELNNKMDIFVG